AAVDSGSLEVALAKKAPSAIPGQTRYPSSRTAASARPVGGHTSVTCSATDARLRPILAAAKYVTAVASIRSASPVVTTAICSQPPAAEKILLASRIASGGGSRVGVIGRPPRVHP